MLNGIEFQTVGAADLKALRPTAVLVNGTYRKLCDADRGVLEGVLRLMRGRGMQANQFEVYGMLQ